MSGLAINGDVVHGLAVGGQAFLPEFTGTSLSMNFIDSDWEVGAPLSFSESKNLSLDKKYFIILIYYFRNSTDSAKLFITNLFNLTDTNVKFFYSATDDDLNDFDLSYQRNKGLEATLNYKGISNPDIQGTRAYLFENGGVISTLTHIGRALRSLLKEVITWA